MIEEYFIPLIDGKSLDFLVDLTLFKIEKVPRMQSFLLPFYSFAEPMNKNGAKAK